MYITKFALKNISRAKARNIRIAVIVVIIAFAVCISLCIRQAAEAGKCVILVTHSTYVAGQSDEVIELEKVNQAK